MSSKEYGLRHCLADTYCVGKTRTLGALNTFRTSGKPPALAAESKAVTRGKFPKVEAGRPGLEKSLAWFVSELKDLAGGTRSTLRLSSEGCLPRNHR